MMDLWKTLAAETRPIFLYGTGNGGDKIIDACHAAGVQLTGVFASDGFVRSRTFRDMPVQAYSDVVSAYGEDIVILLAFGTTLPEVRAFMDMLDEKHTLYIPEVPLYGGEVFGEDCYDRHRTEIETVRGLLGDEESRKIFDDALQFRLTGKQEYLRRTCGNTDAIREMLGTSGIRVILDGGAFRGDSAADFCTALPDAEIIYAAEADSRTFRHLEAYAAAETRCSIRPVNCALWNTEELLQYTSSASRGSGESGRNRRAKETVVQARTIDGLFPGDAPVDLIKLDVEGAEKKALYGGRETICTKAPAMMVSLYHRTEDLWELPLLLHDWLPGHSLHLRRPDCVPFWDLSLYMVNNG
ncbi:MAG: FkbM family methyltransferase [Ruminococcaceae bacterium]|nr:FkbM family methyltransferase [Oscillospiraceae bacterium]